MIFYSEEQRFTQKWLWILILGPAALFSYGAYRQLLLGEAWGSNPASDIVLFGSWVLAGVAIPALFWFARLRTEVRADGIYVRFVPFHRRFRHWRFDEIERIEPKEYSPLGEYGGWGIRLGPSGWAYNVKGVNGVQLVLRSRRRIMIGTQDLDGFMGGVNDAMTYGSTNSTE
jgi:hypothetical protein